MLRIEFLSTVSSIHFLCVAVWPTSLLLLEYNYVCPSPSHIHIYIVQDYREDAREYLKIRAGKTDEEIDRYYVPRTFSERRQAALEKKGEAERLQRTVAQLQKQVDQLQWKVFGTNETEKIKG